MTGDTKMPFVIAGFNVTMGIFELLGFGWKNPGKSTADCLKIMISTLHKLRYGIDPIFRNTAFFHNKLVAACEGVPSCRYALADPPRDEGEFINKLFSTIITYEREPGNAPATQAQAYVKTTTPSTIIAPSAEQNYSDRVYRGRKPQYNKANNIRGRKRCFICKKEDCRSWKHPPHELEAMKQRFKKLSREKYHKAPNFEKRFETRFRHFISSYEGDSDSETDI